MSVNKGNYGSIKIPANRENTLSWTKDLNFLGFFTFYGFHANKSNRKCFDDRHRVNMSYFSVYSWAGRNRVS